ncbi:MAG: FtsQ-type POTRA domain-containing protein [Chloroflexi bacterium]|nr:FtsQ-type POTRA domain-containing protein [Chloroflexota bacterium]
MSGRARTAAAVRSRRSGNGGAARWRFGPSPARAAALLAIVACVLALYGLTTVPALAITRIEVSPLSWTDHDDLLQRLGVDPGINAFLLPTDDLAERLGEIPSVADARVEVRLPDTLSVTVTERQPILAWRVGDVTFLVDREGMLFALASKAGGSAATLPTILDGRAASKVILGIGTRVDPTDLDAATRLASLKPDDVGTGADGLVIRISDADGFVVTTTPASWTAVFGPYSPVLRSPELIPGQVRLLRSILFGQETRYLRITLADETHGTVVPLPSGR